MCSLYTGNSTAEHDFLLIAGELLRYRKAAGNITESIFFFVFLRVIRAKELHQGKKALKLHILCKSQVFYW